ncbi:MAG: AAA family ATPase, partial [Muribaculaceae bacterium]|nr:AAA family ATPase [Muribaculaceae bacterium]
MPTLKYPIGLQSFSEIRKGGYVYVDKTAYIHRLVSTGKYYFLTRPRRFGKSLFLSTLKSYFEGDRELFDGLFISGRVDEWESSPVFYFDFVNFDTSCIEGLQSAVEAHLGTWEEQYGANASEVGYAQRFYGLLKRAVAKTGSRAVVLVDEYDKPLFSTFDNPELNEQYCHILKAIYGTLKAADEYIRFAMLSGVTRFSRLSIFSDLNNLEDISLDTAYSGICGITEGEIEQYLQDGIDEFASKNGLDSTMAMQMLKDNYDGYHFTRRGDDIYNPFSLFR